MQYNQTVAGMFNEAQQKKQQAIQARQSYVPPVQQQQQGGDVFGGSGHGGHAPQPAITGGIFAGIDSAPQQSSGGTTSIFGQTQGFGAQTPSVFGGAAQTPSVFGGGQQQQTGSIFGTPLGAPQPASGPTPFGLGAQSPQQSAFGVAPQAGLGMLPQPSFQLNPSGAQGPSPFGQSLLSGQTNLFQTAPQTPPQQGLAPTMLGGLGAPTPSPAPTLGDVAAGAMVSADSLAHFRADRFTFGAIPEDEPPVEVRWAEDTNEMLELKRSVERTHRQLPSWNRTHHKIRFTLLIEWDNTASYSDPSPWGQLWIDFKIKALEVYS